MAAPDNPHDFVGMMWRMSTMNERFLANHPRVDRSSLPFINVHGKPLTEAQVDTHLHKRLSQCASVGAAFLALHKTGTHCLRRGGATWLFTVHRSFDKVAEHGPWADLKICRQYVDRAMSDLAAAVQTEEGAKRANTAAKALPAVLAKL